MLSFALRNYFLTIALLLLNTSTAFPLTLRDTPSQWSFDLYPTTTCDGPGDPHAGTGSTGCRADLNSVASAYKLNSVPEGCRIEFFDDTMCDSNEVSDIAGPLTSTESCRVPGSGRRYGSYRVTCDDDYDAEGEE